MQKPTSVILTNRYHYEMISSLFTIIYYNNRSPSKYYVQGFRKDFTIWYLVIYTDQIMDIFM